MDENSNQVEPANDNLKTPRRSTTIRKSPRMDDYVTYLTRGVDDPINFSEAVNGAEKKHWMEAINKNNNNYKKLSTKWGFKKKSVEEGN